MGNKIYLPGLDVTAKFGLGKNLRDDGFQTDLCAHYLALAQEFGIDPRMQYLFIDRLIKLRNDDGFCWRYPYDYRINPIPSLRKLAVLAYKPQDSEFLNTFVRAHEEVHALDFLGQGKIVERKIHNNGFALSLDWFDEETKANLGALFSVIDKGFITIDDVLNTNNGNRMKILMESIIPYRQSPSYFV